MLIPPKKSLTKELDFIKEKTEPINNNLEVISSLLYVKENIIIRITQVRSSVNNNAKKLFIQDLKNIAVLGVERVKNAKGEISIKTLIIIYLTEYEKIILKKLKEKISFRIPSIENIEVEFVSK